MYVNVVVYVPGGVIFEMLAIYEMVNRRKSSAAPEDVATVSPLLNLKLLVVPYPVKGVALPAPDGLVPIDGVVLETRLIPNWLDACVDGTDDDIAAIVFAPDVSVVPLTVIIYPLPALVVAPICDVAAPVLVVVSVPSPTDVPVAPLQLVEVMPLVPVQNVSVSGTDAETVI
jgi:hypothetical protein